MARLPRFVIPGQPQHVIVRGNNRESIFYADDDYRFYLEKLHQASLKHHCDIHAYVLMTNHIHLLITPHQEGSLSKAMQMIGRYYVQYFNHTYKRTGTLWEGRYKATLVDSENYLLTCYRYIELNPVRAAMVEHPSDYPWSSYGVNALGEVDKLVVSHGEYHRLGRDAASREKAYRGLFRARISERMLGDIRSSTNKAWVLGSAHFKAQIESKLGRAVAPRARGGDRKSEGYREMCDIDRV